jgi:predicted nucleic acid-binding Zn ribbon protein
MSQSNERTLKDVLTELMNQYRLKQGISESKINAAWQRMMGPTIIKHTVQIRLVKRTLYILIDSPSLKQELFYGREKIKTMLNEELGETFLEEVVIK